MTNMDPERWALSTWGRACSTSQRCSARRREVRMHRRLGGAIVRVAALGAATVVLGVLVAERLLS
jgi:hypothetical protein